MKCRTITIADLKDWQKMKKLELNPPYQRRPVWQSKQRKLLISSIFTGIPIPAIILHKHYDHKKQKEVFDVLDGKQRIETILHFIKVQLITNETDWEIKIKKNDSELVGITYQNLKSKKFNKENNNIADKFWKYEIPLIEYEELTDFFGNSVPTMEVFVRINSTGSSLKKNEIRHANNTAPFFKLGEFLEKRFELLFVNKWKVFSQNEVQRYIFHEFIMELCTGIYFKKFTDRRKKLDDLLYNHNWSDSEVAEIKNRFATIINWIKRILSEELFANTRFKNKSDFYTLLVVLNELVDKNYVTNNTNDNRVLGNTLVEFSKTAQTAALSLKKYDVKNSTKGVDRELIQYIIATRESTDSLANRQIRNDYLQKLLKGFILKQKDAKRIFDPEMKSLLWTRLLQSASKPRCPNPNNIDTCKKELTLEDAQIDHIHPWSKGGKTNLKNAQLICSTCNKSKGARV